MGVIDIGFPYQGMEQPWEWSVALAIILKSSSYDIFYIVL